MNTICAQLYRLCGARSGLLQLIYSHKSSNLQWIWTIATMYDQLLLLFCEPDLFFTVLDVIDHQYTERGSGHSGHYSMSPVTAQIIKLSEFEASATGSAVSDDVFALLAKAMAIILNAFGYSVSVCELETGCYMYHCCDRSFCALFQSIGIITAVPCDSSTVNITTDCSNDELYSRLLEGQRLASYVTK